MSFIPQNNSSEYSNLQTFTKYSVINTGSTIVTVNYRKPSNSQWVYQEEIQPNQQKNIWASENSFQIPNFFKVNLSITNQTTFGEITESCTVQAVPPPITLTVRLSDRGNSGVPVKVYYRWAPFVSNLSNCQQVVGSLNSVPWSTTGPITPANCPNNIFVFASQFNPQITYALQIAILNLSNQAIGFIPGSLFPEICPENICDNTFYGTIGCGELGGNCNGSWILQYAPNSSNTIFNWDEGINLVLPQVRTVISCNPVFPSVTSSPTPTNTTTNTPTPTTTNTPSPTPTNTQTNTTTPTTTNTQTPTPTPTNTTTNTQTPSQTPTQTTTNTQTPTHTPTNTQTPTQTPSNTPEPTPTPTPNYSYYNATQYLNCVQNSAPGAFILRVPANIDSGSWWCGDDGYQYQFDSNNGGPSYDVTDISNATPSACANLSC